MTTVSRDSEEKLIAAIYSSIQRLDIFCQEIRESKEELSCFLSEYYGKVGHYIQTLEEVNQELCSHYTSREHGIDSPAKEHVPSPKASPERLPNSSQICSALEPDQEFRELYLFLVRKFHPDLSPSTTNTDRIKFINHAYHQRQIGTLWKVSFETEWESTQCFPVSLRLRLLQHYHERIQHAALSMEKRLKDLHESEEYQLQQRHFAARLRGEDLLGTIVESLEYELHKQARRLQYVRIREQLKHDA